MAAHTAGEHVRKLQASGAFSCSKAKPSYVEDAGSSVTGEHSSTPSGAQQMPRKGVKNEWSNKKAERGRLSPHFTLVSP